ncbi:AI-2E family transporter [Synechococcus sp. PCC 6312]|uniref:AI-2E family transporter n=1 Tax=Synechococcus sp. (strain ATCC 27167 / PCC 6312) TaxID=195253 RepID=UPI00029F21AD|nr:AI-2E family transporter [Synechococcus sp. PCC 6312]AFY62617.1 putative permease [Synechococcus sp. PCC 6312]
MKLGQWLGLIVTLVCLYVLWEIRQVILLVFLAAVLATALNRIQRQLQAWGLKAKLALPLTILVALGLVLGFFVLIVPPFLQEFRQIATLAPKGVAQLETWLNQASTVIPGLGRQDQALPERLVSQLQPFLEEIFGNFFALFSNTLTVFLNLLLVLVLTVMLVINPQPYRQGFIRLFPAFYRRRIDNILTLCEAKLLAWLTGTGINMVAIGVVCGLTLAVLGVRLVFANAVLAGIFEAIPTIGPVLSLIPPMLIAFLDDPWKAGAVFVAYIVIQQLEQYLLVPVVMAQQVEVLPAMALLAQLTFALFLGFMGLLLALPLLLVGQILFAEIIIKDILDPWQLSESEPESPQYLELEPLLEAQAPPLSE